MKILFYEARHFSTNFHEFAGLKTIFPKNKSPFLAQKLEKKKIAKSVSGYYKTKKEKKKKVAWITKPLMA